MVSFCFFKQKTAYEMRISDWSSDVCSSDLADQRRDELVEGIRRRDKPLPPEIPHRGEGGDAVVETDHDAERGDRIPQHVFGQEAHRCVENRGYQCRGQNGGARRAEERAESRQEVGPIGGGSGGARGGQDVESSEGGVTI